MSDLPLTDLQWDALDAARGTMPDPDRRRSALDAVLALRPEPPRPWQPGDWAEHPEVQIDGFEYEAGWYVLLVDVEASAVALWVDGQGFNGSLDWLSHATPRCDPPDSWVEAGRPGAIDQPEQVPEWAEKIIEDRTRQMWETVDLLAMARSEATALSEELAARPVGTPSGWQFCTEHEQLVGSTGSTCVSSGTQCNVVPLLVPVGSTDEPEPMPDDHEVKRDVEMLRGIESAHELVHIMPFDTICETAGWAADEIERLRAGLQEIADGMPTVMQPTTDFAQRLLAGDTDG